MKARKLPSGSYRVQLTVDGERLSVTAATEDEAIFEAMTLKSKRLQQKKALPTFGECCAEYINSKENVLSPKTIHVYRQIRNHALAEIADTPIEDLTPQRIQMLVNQLSLKRAPKTVHNAHALLSAVLNVYVPDLRLRTTLPRIPKRMKELPTAEDMMKAISGSEIELPCLMGIWLGMRMSEILGAKRSDVRQDTIHLPEKQVKVTVLHIHNTIITVGGKQVEKDSTKTKESTRFLALPNHILDLINQLPPDQEYLVPMQGQALYRKFKRLLVENDLPDITFHDLRHLNASVMLALNIPDKYAMERGGWSTDSILKSVYQHTFTAERKAVDDKVDNYFNSLLHTELHTKNKTLR